MAMLRDIFKPTKALGKDYRLWRTTDGWTSNGFWVILTALEPKWLSKLKETTVAPSGFTKTMDAWKGLERRELRPEYFSIDISQDPKIDLFSNDGDTYHLNAYYVSLVNSFKFNRQDILTTFYATGTPNDQSPILVEGMGNPIAFIAKVRD